MKKEVFYRSKAWRFFSKYIKLSYADKFGMVRCATSGVYMRWDDKNCHAGHYVKAYNGNSTNFNTAFDERNVMPQSYQENRYNGGNQEQMAKAIDRKFGLGTSARLRVQALKTCKLDKFTLDVIGDHYKQKLNDLADKKGIKLPKQYQMKK